MQPLNKGTLNAPSRTWVAVAFLFLLAAAFRAPSLGRLSFHGDEELTALSARSLAHTGVPTLPSGLEYRRAYPFTWANAKLAALLGEGDEASYRALAATAGSVSAPALFLVAQPLVGPPAALFGATLLATSAWHVSYSRMARMYAPFLLFYLLAGCWLWQWATTGTRRYAWLGWASFAIAGVLHVIAVFALGFLLVPVALGTAAVPIAVLAASTVAAACAVWLFDHFVVLAAYGGLEPAPPFAGAVAEASTPTLPPSIVFGAFGMAAFYLMFAAFRRRRSAAAGRSLAGPARVLFGGLALALAGVGFVGGAATAFACWLLLQTRGAVDAIRSRWTWIAVGAVVAGVWTAFSANELGLVAGLKDVLRFPYPYALILAAQLPAVTALAVVPVLICLVAPTQEDPGDGDGVVPQGFALVVLLSLAGVGVMVAWGPSRYLIHLYPFVLLLAGIGLSVVSRGLLGERNPTGTTVGVGMVIALSGVLGSHGIPDAMGVTRLEYGQAVDARVHQYPLRPDHRGAGRFVRDNWRAGDVVIAEDVQQQSWYAGRADYMIRSEEDVWSFLFADDQGTLRDVYIGAELLWTHADFDRVFTESGERRVWIVTSGETHHQREQLLNSDQRSLLRWLDDIGAEVFQGEDGVTRVYCVGCSRESD